MIPTELEHLFSAAAYPGDEALGEGASAESESRLKGLRGKDWRTVTLEDFGSPGAVSEVVRALSREGFIYFLPGLVRMAMSEAENRSATVGALLTRFTHADSEKSPVDSKQQVLEALSARQRGFLVLFFIGMQEVGPTLCPVLVDSAVENLRTGKVRPYREQAAQEWAEGSRHSSGPDDAEETEVPAGGEAADSTSGGRRRPLLVRMLERIEPGTRRRLGATLIGVAILGAVAASFAGPWSGTRMGSRTHAAGYERARVEKGETHWPLWLRSTLLGAGGLGLLLLVTARNKESG